MMAGVKYKPSVAPTIHCPICRPPGNTASGQPRNRPSDTATSGPIIQGKGLCSNTASCAARKPIKTVTA